MAGPSPAASVDPSEPISPELVLVCPELRQLALANAREFRRSRFDRVRLIGRSGDLLRQRGARSRRS
jgi:hypothetical protein